MFGTLVYNEILILPFLGFDKNTKAALKARESHVHGSGLLDRTDDSVIDNLAVTSPHAAYDSSRNQRMINHKMHAVLNKTEEISITEESDISRKR